MPSTQAGPTPSATALQRVVKSGLLRHAMATRWGGDGGCLVDLALAAADLLQQDPEAARVLWAQRLAIEALLLSPNVGLRELWLSDLFSGNRAGTLAFAGAPLTGEDTGRGWLLSGQFEHVPNLPWEGFSLLAPVDLGGAEGWVFLRSEEDGLSVHPNPDAPGLATLRLHRVYFREDEWLGEADLTDRLAPLALALASCRPHPPALIA